MSYTLQPDHYPGLKLIVSCEKGDLTLQSFEPYSKSRPHLVEISVNGTKMLFLLSMIQECLSSCKGAKVEEQRYCTIGAGENSLKIETLIPKSSKARKQVMIKVQRKSVLVFVSDFQKALTHLKQCRAEKLKDL